MESKTIWTKAYDDKVNEKMKKKVDEAAEKYLSVTAEDKGKIFEYVYSKMTTNLEAQQKEVEDENKS
ncbi:MAG: hypothetical protein HYT71_02720 [Candidatus Aenigmarchaeota archaeon]|nr:hypothetical protein [Candidatus Aenigmarchaeota archaeon]